MPNYDYQCVDCGDRDSRVAGLDDHTALCAQCGGLMLRLDEDVFHPYFESTDEAMQVLDGECDSFELRQKDESLTKECCGDPRQAKLCGQCWRLDHEMKP